MPIEHVQSVDGSTTATTSDTIVIPTVVVGDFLVLSCTNKGATASPTVADDDTGGNAWARLDISQNNGASVWFKRATVDTTGKTITAQGFTTACTVGLTCWRGVPSDTPESVGVTQLASGEESVTGVTPANPGSLVLFCNHNRNINGATNTLTGATCGAFDTRVDVRNAANVNSMFVGSKVVTGPTGDISWAQTNSTHPLILIVMAGLPVASGGGVWRGGYSTPRRTDADIREERERLGIIPREQRKLERAAKSIAKRIDPGQSPEEIAAEVARAKEFDKLMAEITARNAAVVDGLALLLMQSLHERILQELRDEDDAIAMLLMEM
jgi:hypothetical protein